MMLQTLVSLGPSHGYAIEARVEQVSGGALVLNMGTLYPALMRLEQRGLVRARWGTTEELPNLVHGLQALGAESQDHPPMIRDPPLSGSFHVGINPPFRLTSHWTRRLAAASHLAVIR